MFLFNGFHSDQMATFEAFNDLSGPPLLSPLLNFILPPGWVLLLDRRSYNGASFTTFVFIHPSGSSLGLHAVFVYSVSPAERPL